MTHWSYHSITTAKLMPHHLFEDRQAITLISEGYKLFAILHLPLRSHAEKIPCVLFCHGFGGNKSGKYRLFLRAAERLSQAGIAALRVDFRGSGDSEGDFGDTTIQSQLLDAQVTAEFLVNHPAIDPTRFGILGRSLGGAIATLLAASLPQTKSLALVAPFFDAKPFLENQKIQPKKGELEFDNSQQTFRFLGHTLGSDCLVQFRALDLRPSLEKIAHLPLLLVQGENDTLLGQYHFDQYIACRKRSSGKTEIVKLPLSDHEFSNVHEQETLLNKTTDWFIQNL